MRENHNIPRGAIMVLRLLILLLVVILTLIPSLFAFMTLSLSEWKQFWSYACKRWKMLMLKWSGVLSDSLIALSNISSADCFVQTKITPSCMNIWISFLLYCTPFQRISGLCFCSDSSAVPFCFQHFFIILAFTLEYCLWRFYLPSYATSLWNIHIKINLKYFCRYGIHN